jgi:ATP-dependent Clp protease ATP-binding subunit ClpX
MFQINTSNILFICGGAFDGLEKIIEARQSSGSIGFGAELVQKNKKNIDELLKQVMPQDLVKFGLIPEFIGRVPVVQSLEQLDEDALVRILTEPRNAITKQYQKLFELDGVELKFEADAVKEIASQALERKTGARGLRSIIEKAMLNVMYQVPSDETIGSVIITKESVLGEGEPKYIYREDEVVEKNTRRRVRSHRDEIA